jgi:hypothetical protein
MNSDVKGPIPKKLKDEFIGWMEAFDNDDLSDGAWFCVLEEGAEKFMKKFKIKSDDTNSAVHQLLNWRA